MAPNLLTLKRDLAILANPPAWFRPIIWVLLRIEAALGGSIMRHGLGSKAQVRARRCLAALESMTDEERVRPEVLTLHRLHRIAVGSGTSVFDAEQARFCLLIHQRRFADQQCSAKRP